MPTKNDVAVSKKSHIRKYGDQLGFAVVEAYNTIRTNISFIVPEKKTGIVFGITSPMLGEGKTFTAVNLAISFAKDGKKVLLIDGDMRRPKVAKSIGLVSENGLSNAIVGGEPLIHKDVLQEGLSVLTAGEIPPNPSELLGSEQMKKLLEKFQAQYDYVIVDLPPVIPVIDAIALSKYLDGLVLVVMHGKSTKRNIVKAVDQLELAQTKILGYVYNGLRRGSGFHGYRYNYNYKYSQDNKK